MPVSFDAASESHGDGLGSTNQASFSWTHTTSITPRGVLVFTFVNADADNATSVTYGGLTVNAVAGGRANSSNASFPGDCKAWFLGSGLPSGNQTVVVNRTNNANTMYAVAVSLNADTNTSTAGTVLITADGTTISQQNVNDGSPGTNSLRIAAVNIGISDFNQGAKLINNNVLAGPQSIWINGTANFTGSAGVIGINDFGARGCGVVRETAAGQGSRPVGFSGTYLIVPAANTGIAAVHLAVTETGGGGGGIVGPAGVLLPSIVTNRIPITGMGGVSNNRVYRF